MCVLRHQTIYYFTHAAYVIKKKKTLKIVQIEIIEQIEKSKFNETRSLENKVNRLSMWIPEMTFFFTILLN